VPNSWVQSINSGLCLGSYDFIARHGKQKEKKVLRTLMFIGAEKNNTVITIPEPCRQSAMLLYKSWRNDY
jgi:hypothetical protein